MTWPYRYTLVNREASPPPMLLQAGFKGGEVKLSVVEVGALGTGAASTTAAAVVEAVEVGAAASRDQGGREKVREVARVCREARVVVMHPSRVLPARQPASQRDAEGGVRSEE